MTEHSTETSGANGHGQPRHVDEYLALGQKSGASDIHLGVNSPPIWRLHGTLQPIWSDAEKLTSDETAALAEGFLTDSQKIQLNERGTRILPTRTRSADFAPAWFGNVSESIWSFGSSIQRCGQWMSSGCRKA